MNNKSSQQENLDQAQHDKMMLEMSDEQRKKMVRGLGQLMRSRDASESNSSTEELSKSPSTSSSSQKSSATLPASEPQDNRPTMSQYANKADYEKALEEWGDPNRPETEADGYRAEALRRAQVRHLMKGRVAPTQPSSQSLSNTPEVSAPTSAAASTKSPPTPGVQN